MIKDYIKYNGRDIEEVKCKSCGTVIRGFVVDDTKTESKVVGGLRTVYQRLKFVSFANYQELIFEVEYEDGRIGTHTTSSCNSCSDLVDVLKAKQMVEIDIANLEKQGRLNVKLPKYKVISVKKN